MKRELKLDGNPPTPAPYRPMPPSLPSLSRAKTDSRRPSRETLWRKNDFTAYAMGSEHQVVMLRDQTPLVLPAFVMDFVHDCDEFHPLEFHVDEYAEKHAWGGLERESLRSWMPKVIEAGILISDEGLLKICQRAEGVVDSPAHIRTIGFPTGGDRVDLVERALRSFHENARSRSREVEFVVADSSCEAAHRDAFRSRLSAVARELNVAVRYSGEEERRRFASELIRRGADAGAVEFALFDPLEIGFACGANRNLLLLDQVDQAFCSIDDDVVCQLAAAPPSESKLKLFAQCDPFTRWMFPDHESVWREVSTSDEDFLASHESLLGRSLSALAEKQCAEELDVSQAGDEIMRRIAAGNARVRASFSGHFGDPGIPTSVYFLSYEGENRRRLTADEAHYRSVLRSRNVFALAPCSAVGDSSTSPGMAMGLDHRELLPPFLPVLHAEDYVYGSVLWQCDPRAMLGHSPLAVRHEPRPGKSMLCLDDLHSANRAVIFEFAHLIRRVILRFSRSESASTAERMAALGDYLASLGRQPTRDFQEFIRGQVIEHESVRIDYLEEQLREDGETPDYWRDDMQRYLEHIREALTFDDFDIPYDLKGPRDAAANRILMQKLFLSYGNLLTHWPKLVEAARDIRVDGIETTLLVG